MKTDIISNCEFGTDCSKCEVCKHDLPLDVIINRQVKSKMKNFGIVPMAGNPSTAQIIIPGMRREKPFGEAVELKIPFVETATKKNSDLYCNGCEFLSRIARPNKETHNCRCKADNLGIMGGGRVIQLNCYTGEKIKKPFWCPVLKEKIMSSTPPTKPQLILPARKDSMLSPEQQEEWKKSRERVAQLEKWKSIRGLCSWNDIKVGGDYHLPPTPSKGRMNLHVATKYMDSMMCYVNGTQARVWIYKNSEDYKFMSPIVK
jgi:hypothetical protein